MTALRRPRTRKSALAVAATLALGIAPLQDSLAAACTFNPASGNWNLAGNWSCGLVPSGPAVDSATVGAGRTVTVNDARSIYTFSNAGTLAIDAATFSLQAGGSTTNTGTINVGGASTAALQVGAGHSINNTGGVISVGNGSAVNLFGSTLAGGTVATTGTGALVVFSSGSNVLSGLTLNGQMDMATVASSRQRIANGLTLNGNVNIANGGILSLDSSLTTGNNQTIGGTATFNLNDGSARLALDGTGTSTLGANVVVRGQGNVGQPINAGGNHTLVNNGRISADVAGGTLTLTPPANGGGSSIVNNNILDARSGGTLVLATHIDNTAGQINALAGSKVVQSGITITGGLLGTSGSGVIQAASSGSNVLNGITLSTGSVFDMTSIANSRNRIANSATINGAFDVGNGGILSLDSGLSTNNSVAVGGTGVINLNDAGARLAIDGSGTSSLGSTLTVRGQGNIGLAINTGGNNVLTNNGLISADVSGGTLDITAPANGGGSSFINNGTLQAINGGSLLLSTHITGNSSSQILAGAGSSVVQNGVTISGTINASGSGVFTAASSGSNVLNGVALNGTLDLASITNSRERIANGLTLNGNVNIANGGILSLDSGLSTNSSVAVGGTGVINLNDAGARLAIDGNGTSSLGSTLTVRGQGNIGLAINTGGNNVLTNNGLISADVSGGTLNITAPANGGGSSFINNGTLQAINGGSLLLSTHVTGNSGSQILAGAGSSVVQNGVTVSGVINTSGAGVFSASNSSSNVLNGVALNGTLDMASITTNSRERIANGLTLNGNVNIANGGILSLDSSLTTGGNQTIGGTATFNLNDSGARLAMEGTGTTTLGANVVVRGQGSVGQPNHVGGNHTLVNNGRISADVAGGTLTLVPPANGGGSSIVNNKTLDARNGGTLVLATHIDNTAGQINALAGSKVVQNGITITGGLLGTSGSGVIQAASNGNNFLSGVTLASGSVLDLTGIANARERIANSATINGDVNIGNGGVLSLDSANSSNNSVVVGGTGVINLNDSGAWLAIEGNGSSTLSAGLTVRGQGHIGQPLFQGGNNTLFNNGVILADGGTLTIQAPANGGGSLLAGTGTLQVNGGTLAVATGTASSQGKLVIGGTGSLSLGTQNLTLSSDYTNAQWGSGNTFNRRAGVTGTGQILAGGDAAQIISGAGVTGGNTNNATLTIGNMHVGTNTYNYTIANGGSTGPTLRGAVQTSVNGGNITDGRLAVTDGNYNAGAPGGAGAAQTVTFTANSAGALGSMTGQAINLRSNFDNIADQKLNIVLGAGAAAYNLAGGSALPAPVTVANQRVGGSNSVALNVGNTAAAGSFSEDLNAGIASLSGAATASGSVSGLLAGASSGGINVGVSTASAGAKTGTVNLAYTSTGTVNGTSNGLGQTSVGSQAVTVNGNVYQTASGQLVGNTLNFGTLQVGQQVSQNLVVRNTASGPAGFVEDLNASFGASGNGQISGSGSLSGIAAGSNSTAANGTMTVTVTGSTAGALNSGIAVNYFSAGAVGGVSNGLGVLGVGSEQFGVNGTISAVGNVINQASPQFGSTSVDLGAVRVGAASPTASIALTNQATAAPQAALNASISSNGAPITALGSVSLLAPGASSNALQVGLNTAVAGNYTGANAGSATVQLVSDASNVGGCAPNCQMTLAPQTISVSGKVYTAAVGQLGTPVVDFGIVRVGDTVSAKNITVSNTAAVTALNDTLRATLSGVSGPFTGGGAAAGIAAGASGQINVGLNTASAGVFNANGSVAFLSQNPDMADVAAGANAGVQVKAQVNNLANADFGLLAGLGTLKDLGGGHFQLNLGNLALGSNGHWMLQIENDVAGPADALRGSFDLGSVDDFLLGGFGLVDGLEAGQAQGGLGIDFTAANLGQFEDTVVFNGFSYNASDPTGLSLIRSLQIVANVFDPNGGGNVPEPGTLALLMLAGLSVWRSRALALQRQRGLQ
ncbi:MAG: choice-of-anchor D domain-containing protein [Rubrivivax sp.]